MARTVAPAIKSVPRARTIAWVRNSRPGEPDHGWNPCFGRRGGVFSDRRGPTHVGEHEVLQADRLDCPGRVKNRLAGSHDERALVVGVVRLNHLLTSPEDVPRVPARSGESVMRCKQSLRSPRPPAPVRRPAR